MVQFYKLIYSKNLSFTSALLILFIFSGFRGSAQSAGNYTFSSSSSGSLAADANGNTINMGSGTTQLIGPGITAGAASGTPNIGFDFWFMGVRYTQFSANAYGGISLGSTAIGSTVATLPNSTTPTIAAFLGSAKTNSTGKVHYKLVGTAPNRALVIEFLNMGLNSSSTTVDATYQARLYESTGVIEFVYGSFNISTGSTAYYIGFSANTTSGKFATLIASSATVTNTGTTATSNASNSSTISALTSASNGSRKVFTFTPPTPSSAPTSALTFSSVTKTGMTINWTDNATNEDAFVILSSLDGITYNYLTTVNSTTSSGTGTGYTYTVSGLGSSTTYYYKVANVTEGNISSYLSGSQATTSGTLSGSKTIGNTGSPVFADYANLTSAISDIQSKGLSGSLTLKLLPSYPFTAETFPLTFSNLTASASSTITIMPDATVSSAITITSSSTVATVDLNGATYVTIDGRAGGTGSTKMLTIANTNTASGVAIRFINDASYNTLQYITFTGVNTNTTTGTGAQDGVVYFGAATASPGLGNNYNTFSYCDVRDGTTTPAVAVYAWGTDNFGLNDNIYNTFSYCNIYNFYKNGSEADAFRISRGNNSWTIDHCSIYQTVTRTPTTAVSFYGFNMNNTIAGSGNNYTITNNYIGGSAPSCGGTAWTVNPSGTTYVGNNFYNYFSLSSTGTRSTISGNTVANFVFASNSTSSGTQGVWSGIAFLAGLADISNNTIGTGTDTGNIVITTSGNGGGTTGIGAQSSTPGTINITNNTIGSVTVLGSTTAISQGFYGIYLGAANSASTNYNISNNSIGSTTKASSIHAGNATKASTSATSQPIVAIYNSATALGNVTISNNTIANIINYYTSTGTGNILRGIISGIGINTITGNTIYNLTTSATGTGTTTAATIIGIQHTSTNSILAPTISQNTIYGLSCTAASAASTVSGIYYTATSTPLSGSNLISRNFIHSLNSSSPTGIINGIYIAGGTTNIQNNMLRLGIDASGLSIATAHTINAINEAGGTNNFYFNSVYIGGTGVGTTTSNTYALISSLTSGTRAYQDNILNNVRSNSSTGGKHYAIKLGATSGAACNYNEYNNTGTGATFGAIGATDYATLTAWQNAVSFDLASPYGDPQFSSPAGSSATVDLHIGSSATPVEGAGLAIAAVSDDYDGQARSSYTPTDIGADAGSFTASDNTPPSISYTAAGNTGSTSNRTVVATITDISGIGTGTGAPRIYYRKGSSGSFYSATATTTSGSSYTFTLDYTNVTGGSVSAGDVIQYYIAAQDNASTSNGGTFPVGGSGTTPPGSTQPSIFSSYTILTALTGTYYVGTSSHTPSATYATLTAAITDYNAKGMSSAVSFVLIDNTYSASETFPIVINANLDASATNTLTIKPDASVSSTISGSSSSAILKLLQANYVTIDGSNNASISQNLTITNTSTSATTAAIWIASNGTGLGTTNSTIKNCLISTGVSTTASTYGINVAGTTIGSTGADNDNITLQNNFITKAYYGIWANGSAAVSSGGLDGLSISSNTIGSSTATIGFTGILTGNAISPAITLNTVQNITTSVTNAAGISLSAGAINGTISGNTIKSLTSTASGPLMGISISATGNNVSGNSIYTLNNTNSGGWASRGIYVNTGANPSNVSLVNNIIYDMVGYSWTSGTFSDLVAGIVLDGSSGGVNIYYNSVNLYGNHTGPNSATVTSALLINSSVTGLNIADNIFVSTYHNSSSTTDKNYAIYCFASNSAFTTLNYDDYYVNGTYNVLGFLSADKTTLSTWQAASGQDANSLSVDPSFAASNNLTPGPSVLAKGTPISGITTDNTGFTRSTSTPSMGAFENGSDVTPPTITYSTLASSGSTSSRPLVATITDISGIATGSNAPQVYYRKGSTGTWSSSTATSVSGSAYTFTIDYSTVSGGSVSAGDVIQYFVAAQDASVNNNFGTMPTGGSGSFTAITAPSSPNSYTILSSVGGTYYVGTSTHTPAASYATITAAIADYNSKGMNGGVNLVLIDNSYSTSETFPIVINANADASATNVLTIKPDAGVSPTISGSNTGSAIIKLNGADYVTIDGSNSAGGTTKDLTITNTGINAGDGASTSGNGVIWIASATSTDGATNNTIKNCNITGNSSVNNYIAVYSGGATSIGYGGFNALTANSYNTIKNNFISKAKYGVWLKGTSYTVPDVSNAVIGNTLGTATSGDGNDVGGIAVQYQNGTTVSGNEIANVVGSGATPDMSNLAAQSIHFGIHVRHCENTVITGNKVHNIVYNGTSAYYTHGIDAQTSNYNTSSLPSNNVIVNNLIYDVRNSSTASTSWSCSGINLNGGYGDKAYFNTVALTTQLTTSTGPSAGISNGNPYNTTATSNIDVRDNIFAITGTASSTTKFYGHYTTNSSYTGNTINYNDYYISSISSGVSSYIGYYNATNYATFGPASTSGTWQNATSVDASSYNIDPLLSITYIPASNTLNGGGVNLSGYSTDLTGATRSTPPDLGAYEYTPANYDAGVTLVSSPSGAFGGSTYVIVTIKNYGITALSSASISWSIDGVAQTSVSWTTGVALSQGQTAIDTLGLFNFSLAAHTYTIYAASSSPDGNTDGNTTNDAITVFRTSALRDTVTVGTGGIFTTLTAAVAALNSSGVTGPLVFSLISSSYSSSETFPIIINTIAGASATNTITLKPASGVTAVISGASTSSILKINSAAYVIIDGSNTKGGTSKDLTFTNTSTGTNTASIWIASNGTANGSTHDSIKNCNINAGSATVTSTFGVFTGGTSISTAGTGDDNDYNTIQNNIISTAYYGIYAVASSATGANDNLAVIGNSVGSFTSASTVNFNSLYLKYCNNASVTGNDFFGINQSSSFDAVYVGAGVTSSSFNGNKVHDLTNASTNRVTAFNLSAGASSNNLFANNLIYNVIGDNTGIIASFASAGFYIIAGSGYSIYYNSVNLSGNRDNIGTTKATTPSACVYVGSSASSLDIRDNIFSNSQTEASGSYKSYAIYSDAANSAYSTINFNDYYVSGAQGMLGYLSADQSSISAWKTATGQDVSSISSDPQFGGATDLHPGVSSLVLAAATPLSITTDFIKYTRGTGSAGSATAPSIGAYEQGGDFAAPAITFTAFGNSGSTANRVLVTTITDASGVATGTGAPLIYYRKGSSGSWASSTATTVSGSSYTFTIDYTNVSGGSVSGGDFIQYYVAAQDVSSNNNTGTMPVGGGGITPPGSTAPTTPGSYTILPSLSGTYYVGTSTHTPAASYATITAAIAAYNSKGMDGAVNFILIDNTYSSSETFPITITTNSDASATNVLTIKPDVGVSPTISGTQTLSSIFKLNGADYVTIDGSNTSGGTSRDLTITNTGVNGTTSSTTGNAVIWLASATATDGATYNTIKNCKITGNSSTNTYIGIFSGYSSGIGYGGTNALTPNSYNTIQNNFISKAGFGIWLKGVGGTTTSSFVLDQNNAISGNILGSSTSGDGFDIGGIVIQYQNNASVSGNEIANVIGSGQIQDVINASTGQIHFGIHVRLCQNSTVAANKIHNIELTGTSISYTFGIHLDNNVTASSAFPSANTIVNNMIYDIRVSSTGPTSFVSGGITDNRGYGDKFYYNSVNMTGQLSVTSGPSAAFSNGVGYNTANATVIDARNNIFVISGTSTSTPSFYGHYTTLATYTGSSINYNDFYVTSTTAGVTTYTGRFNSTNYAALTGPSGWQTATSVDANSLNIIPYFNSSIDLHSTQCLLKGKGVPISGITKDFDGDTRRTTTTDIGADEFPMALSGRWSGGAGSSWTNTGNWCDASLPSKTTNVEIPAKAINQPSLSAGDTGAAANITIDANASLSISGGKLSVSGNLINNNSFTNSGGIIELNGNGAQNFPRGSYYKLVVTGQGIKTPASDITIHNALVMNSGIIATGTSQVSLDSVATLTESDTSYVSGTIITLKNIVSKGSTYTFGNIGVKMVVNGTTLPGMTTITRKTGTGNSVTCYHYAKQYNSINTVYSINPTNNGNLRATLTLYYKDADLNSLSESSLQVYAKHGGTNFTWVGAASKNAALKYIVSNATDSFSDWTLGGASNPLPVELFDFTARLKNAVSAELNWQTASELNNAHFDVERSEDGYTFEKIQEVEGFGTTQIIHNYGIIDNFGASAISTALYYRLKQVDQNGAFAYSDIRKVSLSEKHDGITAWYNNSSEKLCASFNVREDHQAGLRLVDAQGKTIAVQNMHFAKGDNTIQIDMQGFAKGIYTLLYSDGTTLYSRKIVRY